MMEDEDLTIDGDLTQDEMDILSEIFRIIDEMLISIDRCGGYISNLNRNDLFTIADKLGVEY